MARHACKLLLEHLMGGPDVRGDSRRSRILSPAGHFRTDAGR
jgi:hypothetical protein